MNLLRPYASGCNHKNEGELKKTLLDVSEAQDCEDETHLSYLKKIPTFDNRFCAWKDAQQKSVPLPETSRKRTERSTRQKDRWKEWKSSDIVITYVHSLDYKDHIKQYRYQYTYKSKSISKQSVTPFKVHSNMEYYPVPQKQAQTPLARMQTPNGVLQGKYPSNGIIQGKLRYDHRQPSPKQIGYTARTHSEPDILDLQHRYKMDPGAIKAALIANLGPLEPTPHMPTSDPLEDAQRANGLWKNPIRTFSAKSVKATIQARLGGTVNLTPTSASRGGVRDNIGSGQRHAVTPTTRGNPALEPIHFQPLNASSSTQSMPVLLSNGKTPLSTHSTTLGAVQIDQQTMLVLRDISHIMSSLHSSI